MKETKQKKVSVKIENVETLEIAVVEKKVSTMMSQVSDIVINSEEDLGKVSDLIQGVKKFKKLIEQEVDKIVKPLKEIIETRKAEYKPFLERTEEAERILKGKAQVFLDEQEKIKKEKLDKIANRVEKGTLKQETALKKMDDIGEIKSSVKTESSKLITSITYEPLIVDETKIPDEYWIPRQLDMVKIGKVIRAGGIIAGVDRTEKKVISSRR